MMNKFRKSYILIYHRLQLLSKETHFEITLIILLGRLSIARKRWG